MVPRHEQSDSASRTPGASLFGVLAGEGGQPLPGAGLKARNTLDGTVFVSGTDSEGRFVLAGLPSGLYEIEGQLSGWIIPSLTGLLLSFGERHEVALTAISLGPWTYPCGGLRIDYSPGSLRHRFNSSQLVVVGTIGVSVAGGDDRWPDTELLVTAVWKGSTTDERPVIVRWDSVELPPGTEVLAFLSPSGDGRWHSATWDEAFEALTKPELAAHHDRLEALVNLRPGTERHPVELLEWLVATVEDPRTRAGAVFDLSWALWRLDEMAEARATSAEQAAADLLRVTDLFRSEGGTLGDEPQPELLGALLTDQHRARLTRALETTEGLTQADLGLCQIVQRWAGDTECRLDPEREPR